MSAKGNREGGEDCADHLTTNQLLIRFKIAPPSVLGPCKLLRYDQKPSDFAHP